MKYVWELKDITDWNCGRWFGLPVEDAFDSGEEGLDYLVTRTYKMGFCQQCRYDDEPDATKRKPSQYCMVAITDGCIYGHASPEEFVEMLNSNGYVPLFGKELMRRLAHEATRSQL